MGTLSTELADHARERRVIFVELALSGLMLGALGMLISSGIKQLENFAGVMNFVIFPMFFASSALYPLWRVRESSPLLYYVCELNPFTQSLFIQRQPRTWRVGAPQVCSGWRSVSLPQTSQ